MQFFLNINGQAVGPYSVEDIGMFLQQGQIEPTVPAALAGTDTWAPLNQLIQIQSPGVAAPGQVPGQAPAQPGMPYQQAPLTVAQPKTGNGVLITVIVLVAVVAVVAVIGLTGGKNEGGTDPAAEASNLATIERILAKLETYRKDGGQYPSDAQGLDALLKLPTSDPVPRLWRRGFSRLPVDSWGHSFSYKLEGEGDAAKPRVTSPGPDGKTGTDDDISVLGGK